MKIRADHPTSAASFGAELFGNTSKGRDDHGTVAFNLGVAWQMRPNDNLHARSSSTNFTSHGYFY